MTDKAAGERTAGAELDELWAAFEAGHWAWPTMDHPTRRALFDKWVSERAALRSQPEGKEPEPATARYSCGCAFVAADIVSKVCPNHKDGHFAGMLLALYPDTSALREAANPPARKDLRMDGSKFVPYIPGVDNADMDVQDEGGRSATSSGGPSAATDGGELHSLRDCSRPSEQATLHEASISRKAEGEKALQREDTALGQVAAAVASPRDDERVTTYTPMMWMSMTEEQRYEEYIRVRMLLSGSSSAERGERPEGNTKI